MIGLLAALVSMVVGAVLGIVALPRRVRRHGTDAADGLVPGAPVDRADDRARGDPRTVLAIIVLVIGLTSWAWTARLVRSQTLSIRERPFVERVRGLGASDSRIMLRHVLPNVMPAIIAQTILSVARDPGRVHPVVHRARDPCACRGADLEQAFETGAVTLGAWWWIGAPGVCIVLLVLAFTMCSTALRSLQPEVATAMNVLEVGDLAIDYATTAGPVPAVRGVSLTSPAARCSAWRGVRLRQVDDRPRPAAPAPEGHADPRQVMLDARTCWR
jgi:peptide/nickel transport system permease protein